MPLPAMLDTKWPETYRVSLSLINTKCLWDSSFSQVGVPCRVLERAETPRAEGSAIALWSNAWRALEALDAADQLRPDHLLLER
jgi:hypothetical protein